MDVAVHRHHLRLFNVCSGRVRVYPVLPVQPAQKVRGRVCVQEGTPLLHRRRPVLALHLLHRHQFSVLPMQIAMMETSVPLIPALVAPVRIPITPYPAMTIMPVQRAIHAAQESVVDRCVIVPITFPVL